MILGRAFQDFVSKGQGSKNLKRVRHAFDEPIERPWRLLGLFLFFILSFTILVGRLFHLTVIHGSTNRILSEANRTREVVIPAPRGSIFDRNGEPLVRNIPLRFGGSLAIGRYYPLGEKAAHLLGYTGEVNEEEVKRLNAACTQDTFCQVHLGEFIGRGGVEESYDNILRGSPGRQLIEVDAMGKTIRELGIVEPKKGDNVKLSIDRGLQEITASALASASGAIIVSEPSTGEILALVSSPSFDPNLFITRDPSVSDIITRTDQPLFNRAAAGVYPPGSTYKIITSTAGLELGKITSSTQFEDTGILRVGPYSFGNWYFLQYGKTEGMVDVVRAITRSNDIFFYHTGELVGAENLSIWSKKMGLGSQLGIDLPGEASGVVPNSEWKKFTFNESWYLGDTYHISIGQGNLLTTPLQVNAFTNIIANGGNLCHPKVVMDESLTPRNKQCQPLGIQKETIDLIREGMKGACATGGTGWPLFNFKIKNEKLKIDNEDFLATYESTTSATPVVKIPIACKTGTAEYGDLKKTHAWITGFAPINNPKLSITVLVEGGGEGSTVAGPIAKKIFEYWFSR